LESNLANPNLVATIFAPTNSAFTAAIEALGTTASSLLANTDLLARILTTHVVPDVAALSTQLTDRQQLPTLQGTTLTVDLTSGVKIISPGATVNVVTPDIRACKAVIHIIDGVLLPSGVGNVPVPPPTPAAPGEPVVSRADVVSTTPGTPAVANTVAVAG
jgi:uncharacterized surface protein with fasciclin (FAS1) repeats